MAVFNKAVMAESAAPVQSDVNVFDIMIEAERLDQSLFESLIEVDFAEAYNEAGIIALTEEEQAAAGEAQKKGIFAKIWEAIQNAGKAIAKLFDRIISFISNLIHNDARIVSTYGRFMNFNNLSECPVKGKYVNNEYFYKQRDKYSTFFSAISANGRNAFESFDSDYSRDNLVKDSGEDAIIKVIGNDNFTKMCEVISSGYKNEMKKAKDAKVAALRYLKELENDYKKQGKETDNKETAAAANDFYKATMQQAVNARKVSAQFCSIINTALAVNRGCYLKIAAWAAKAEKAEAKPEEKKEEKKTEEDVKTESALQEAIDMLIEMENDAFIESITV